MFLGIPATKKELLAILDDIRERVEAEDSFEGFLNYLMPDPDTDPDADFMVEARYRIGNSMGQGGMRMIGKMVDSPADEAKP